MSKEPGQMAYEAWYLGGTGWAGWDRWDKPDQSRWARVESAIRADEREKVIEIVKTRHSVFYDNPEIQFRQIIASITALGAEHG